MLTRPGTCLLTAVCLLAAAARAAEPLRLSVVRSQDAADCPDEAQLAALVAALARPGAPPAGSVLVDAQFFRQQEHYAVSLRVSGERSGQRSLVDPGPSCAPLAEATALTVAMLLDPGMPRPAPTVSAPVVAPPPPAPARPAEPLLVLLSSGALLTTSITATPAVGVVTEASVQRSRPGQRGLGWRVSAGGAWLPARSFDLPPGRVEVALLAGVAQACATIPTEHLLVAPCARLGVGRYVVEAHDFSRNEQPRELWVGAGLLGLLQVPLAPQIYFEAQGGWMPSLRHRSFAIEGLGVAFDPSPWAGTWLSASLALQAW